MRNRLVLPLLILLCQGCSAMNPPSSMPMGEWRSGSGDMFHIEADGLCVHTTQKSSVAGHCHWDPDYKGGLLTLYHHKGKVLYNVMWLDQDRFQHI